MVLLRQPGSGAYATRRSSETGLRASSAAGILLLGPGLSEAPFALPKFDGMNRRTELSRCGFCSHALLQRCLHLLSNLIGVVRWSTGEGCSSRIAQIDFEPTTQLCR